MNCPRCSKEVRPVMIESTEVDICYKCEGIWFDHGELKTLIDRYGEELKDTELAKSWQGKLLKEEPSREGGLHCPKCSEMMIRYNYQYSSNIPIDGCKNGCGIWLDDGEISRILEFLVESARPVDANKKAELLEKIQEIKTDQIRKEKAMIDSLVTMDDKPGLKKYPGEFLQFIYSLFHKIGL